MSAAYLDSSALVKLAVTERESGALRRYVRTVERKTSSQLARVEVIRAVREHGASHIRRAREILRRISFITIDDALLEHAAMLDPPSLRTLDSIHLAAALSLGGDLRELVTYDQRMIEGAHAIGVPVVSPR